MGKIVINKHYDNTSDITKGKFCDKGELIIDNEPGFEGLFILNSLGETVRVGFTKESGGVTPEIEAYLRKYYMTSGQTIAYVKSVSGNITNTLEEIVSRFNEEIRLISGNTIENREKIDELSGSTILIDTKIDELSNLVNSGLTEVDNKINAFSSGTISEINGLNEKINSISSTTSYIAEGFDSIVKIVNNLSSTTVNVSSGFSKIVNIVEELSAVTDSFSSDITKMKQDIIDISAATQSIKSSDHVVLNTDEYKTLITSGSVIVSGKVITYKSDIFYCVYEITPTPESGGTQAEVDEVNKTLIIKGEASIDGDILTVSNVNVDENGVLTFLPVQKDYTHVIIDDNTKEMIVENGIFDDNNKLLSVKALINEDNKEIIFK